MAEIAYTVVVGNKKVQGVVFRPVTLINNQGTKKPLLGATPDGIDSMVMENANNGEHYTKEGEFPNKITYQIFNNHPNKMAFDELYEEVDISSGPTSTLNPDGGASRRRRPSRKYKKSKRVLRRKSRSTRRR